MTNLDENRKKINSIDKQMAILFEQRMECAQQIADYKLAHGLAIVDEDREKQVVEANCKYIKDKTIKEYYINYIQNTMKLSKSYQSRLLKGLKIAYSGVEGAFAHIAAKNMFPNANYISYNSFENAYKAVENGNCDVCVLPLENSYAGDVGLVLDLMFSGSLYINQIYELEVVHNLLAKKGAKINNIKTVISHPQALAQCSEFIAQNNFNVLESQNTAVAAKFVADGEDKTLAAIASVENANIYNLDVLQTKINTSQNNTTRFGAFCRCANTTEHVQNKNIHSIIMFSVKNEAGALAQSLNIIGKYKFNMRSLRSRPMKKLIWNYYFYVELEGDVNSKNGSDMLNALKTYCDKLKVVGCYKY